MSKLPCLWLTSVFLAGLVSITATAQTESAQISKGRQVFERQCAPCHGQGVGADGSAMLPGTAALDEKYEGVLPAALELRSDLSTPVLSIFIRRGAGAMPGFRPSEITDEDIAAIADYLAFSSSRTAVD